MELFLSLLRVAAVYLLLPTFFITLVIGWARRGRTNRAFPEILLRAILMTVAVGLPACVVLIVWLAWWTIGHVPAPD